MANFDIAYRETNRNEGGYANVKGDTGGETYGGISRRWWPHWQGWPLIDQIKRNHKDFLHLINTDERLKKMKRAFYKINFWNALMLSKVNNQGIANQIYDMSVSAGMSAGAKLAERIAGLPETGKMSENLIKTLNHD